MLRLEQERLNRQKIILEEFKERIRELKKRLERGGVEEYPILVDLGDVYLEAQKYLNSLDAKDRNRWLEDEPTLVMGSHEIAIWAYKMALERRPENGELNLTLGKIYDELDDEENAERHALIAKELFTKSRKASQLDKVEQLLNKIKTEPTPNSVDTSLEAPEGEVGLIAEPAETVSQTPEL